MSPNGEIERSKQDPSVPSLNAASLPPSGESGLKLVEAALVPNIRLSALERPGEKDQGQFVIHIEIGALALSEKPLVVGRCLGIPIKDEVPSTLAAYKKFLRSNVPDPQTPHNNLVDDLKLIWGEPRQRIMIINSPDDNAALNLETLKFFREWYTSAGARRTCTAPFTWEDTLEDDELPPLVVTYCENDRLMGKEEMKLHSGFILNNSLLQIPSAVLNLSSGNVMANGMMVAPLLGTFSTEPKAYASELKEALARALELNKALSQMAITESPLIVMTPRGKPQLYDPVFKVLGEHWSGLENGSRLSQHALPIIRVMQLGSDVSIQPIEVQRNEIRGIEVKTS